MAFTHKDHSLVSDLTSSGEKALVGEGVGSVERGDCSVSKNETNTPDPQPSTSLTRPSLVQLGSSNGQSSMNSTAHHPKKFSSVNINKKFLEKNSSAPGTSPTSSTLNATKSGSPAARPQAQTSTSHSRLVAAKLTATPTIATGTTGWSRPSSAAPSSVATGANSPIGSSPLPSSATVVAPSPAAPQLPHVGKVIQPQPRTVIAQQSTPALESSSVKAASKPVWGNVVPPVAAPVRPDIASNDFPTAAEVAKVASRKPKSDHDTKPLPLSDSAAATKQARMEEADTFRGVHLDPNAHHWDEMEEDDDNFLGGVIEFGDGRQYKVESSEAPASQPSPLRIGTSSQGQGMSPKSAALGLVVGKEERFADDFDRSWPKSRPSPTIPSHDILHQFPAHTSSGSATVSPILSNSHPSPQESSRSLFNERSNRLEPYNRSGPNQHVPKRSNYYEQQSNEPRASRESGHSSHGNVQLLQKTGFNELPPRPRGFSNASTGSATWSSGGYGPDRQREREHHRREPPTHGPHLNKEPSVAPQTSNVGRSINGDRGRRTNMGPPVVPEHAMRRTSQDSARQPPPHLASPNVSERGLPTRDNRDSNLFNSFSNSSRHPSQSPVLSHTSASLISPSAAPHNALPQLSAPELDEARRDVMQSAAARAKQRRQQEEEEREAQKERARRKALELEEKMKAVETEKVNRKAAEETRVEAEKAEAARLGAEELAREEASRRAAKDAEVISIIEDAVKGRQKLEGSKQSSGLPPKPPPQTTFPKTAQPPFSDSRSGPTSRKQLALAPRSLPVGSNETSKATQAETWRNKSGPQQASTVSQSPPPRQQQLLPSSSQTGHSRQSVTSFLPPPPMGLERDNNVADASPEDLEIVEFSNMGAFVGADDADLKASSAVKTSELSSQGLNKSSRPVAMDFFDETPSITTNVPVKNEGAWRNDNATRNESVNNDRHRQESTDTKRPADITHKETTEFHNNQTTYSSLGLSQRNPRNQNFYKEATINSLDDAMSRIKGALVDMHAGEASKETQNVHSQLEEPAQQPSSVGSSAKPVIQKERWLPPALRIQNVDSNGDPHGQFDVSSTEPPRTPRLEESYIVRLPSISHFRDIIGKKQLHLFSRFPLPARFDVLSFDPPVEGMNRSFLVNDVLFRRPHPGYKGKVKYQVSLPRSNSSQLSPKVNIPNAQKLGTFGRRTVADGVATWRKSNQSSTTKVDNDNTHPPDSGLSTVSRSPPPETQPTGTHIASIPKSSDSQTKSDEVPRSRLIPKMPAGSAVAVYRDFRVDVIGSDPKPLVNFIVTSELEDASKENSQGELSRSQPSITVSSPVSISPAVDAEKTPKTNNMLVNGTESIQSTEILSTEHNLPSLIPNRTESKSSDDSSDTLLTTPPHQSAAWSRSTLNLAIKEPAVRGPDPEHLKAVWSQTSNKAGMHAVNSLEGIADDLTALPFTLQDVKSEDGETPPPIPSAPSRMSLHDVTRAFQQVPSSSSNSVPLRMSISPPLTSAPVARPSTYSYSPLPSNMRPAYAAYPSPMLSHSPGPVMYSPMSPNAVPNRMQVNGHAPLYSQPMWMTMTGPAPQSPGAMMRPMASPYPGQMMPYASPAAGGMYAPLPPNMQPNAPQQQNGAHTNRGRNLSVMSPVMSHAHATSPMYSNSPVLVHAPVMQVPQNATYLPVPTGRGQPRADNGQMSVQHPSGGNPHIPSHPGYNPHSTAFVRPTW